MMTSVKSKLLGSFSLSIVALILLWFVYQQSNAQLLEARRWVEHTHTVLEKVEHVMSLLKDLETGQRGFLITGQDVFLEPYNLALAKLPATISQIRSLTSDNPDQQKRLDRLENLYAAKLAFCQKAIELRKTQGIKASTDLIATQAGKKLMDESRVLSGEMEDEESTLLQKRVATADQLASYISLFTTIGVALSVAICGAVALALVGAFSKAVRNLQESLDTIGQGDLSHKITITGNDEFGKLGLSFNAMADKLKTSSEESTSQSWLNSNLARFGQMLQGERDLQVAGQKILSEFASVMESRHGMFYVLDSANNASDLSLLASYAHHERKNLANSFALGQGLVGQCALEKQKILVSNLPDDYIRISSGVGEASPASVVVVPVIFDGKVKAVIEQASFECFSTVQLDYLDQAASNLGVVLSSIEAAERTEKLLRQEQMLTEELQSQQEELTESNRKLEALAESLQASEEELRQQQEELQQNNEELDERSRAQAKQNEDLEAKNIELEELRLNMQEKAQQLTLTSKYKSEFLSNMSHELRTPLNSLLILSRVLVENADGNLTPKQVKFAGTIHSAGSDLLVLIDDVLDISKIEAGAMSIDVAEESLMDICNNLMETFDALAKEKNVSLSCELHPQLPRVVKTDGRRLQQILKNLLSNALKFTESGSVTLKVEPVQDGWQRDSQILNSADMVVSFAVIDSGIGIPKDKQSIIFEAFQQADGTTNRKFGGTGLGLAISREIAHLLGGEIGLKSEPGKGSTFTFYLPREHVAAPESVREAGTSVPALEKDPELVSLADRDSNNGDDRADIDSGDKVLLVVQQDPAFAAQVIEIAHGRGFKVVTASQGKTALSLVRRFKPDAIALDISSLDKDGWTFLDRLKRDSTTRHIPVHIICNEERAQQGRRLGAIGYSTKPASKEGLTDMINRFSTFVNREPRQLLIVEDNQDELQSLEALIGGDDVRITSASTGEQALNALKEQKFDCMVLDLGLPDMTGFELLDVIQKKTDLADLSIIIHTARSLTAREETELRRYTEAIVVKGARSAERLLDETSLFLHRVEANLPEQKRKILERLHLKDPLLSGRKVLIVDDDVRHIFAVTSMLEQYDMQVIYAENGKEALDILAKTPGLEIVLMDVMMPDMDGLQTMRAIRKLDHFKTLPIIALTAKAIKGDREECMAAGASDYLSKPVDSDQLLSLMRVWLY
jgi:hypothetical protein